MTKTKTNYVSVYADKLETIIRREHKGQYGYSMGEEIHRITSGPLEGRLVAEDWGFRWRGNSGGLAVDHYLVPVDSEQAARARVEGGAEADVSLAEMACDWTVVRVLGTEDSA